MKLLHLSDLHLGKRVNGFSMIEDQSYILERIFDLIETAKPDAILIAGDLYDKAIPSTESVSLCDAFLTRLVSRGLRVFIISGNHDSAERLAFGADIMTRSGIYFSPVYDGNLKPITLKDEFGPLRIFLLPFVKPSQLRACFPEETIETYTDALAAAIAHMPIDHGERNVLLTHQFVTGATRCDSEDISLGGSGNVDATVFEPFDYVALGHLHGPQSIGRETIRYCGSPLKYSFSECRQIKSATLVDLREKGSVRLSLLPLEAMRDMLQLKDSFAKLMDKTYRARCRKEDYVAITLTDEDDIPDAIGKLRQIYPNLMKLDYDNARTRALGRTTTVEKSMEQTPGALFGQFYEQMNQQPMREEQRAYIDELIERLWREEP